MDPQKAIENFGYKAREARVYLTALHLGECTVTDIAQKLKLPRTSVQVAVDKLHADGLMNFYVRKRYKRWSAEKPEKLLSVLQEKQNTLRSIVPLLQPHHKESKKPSVKVFMGVEELKLIHEDVLETKSHIDSILPWSDWVELLGQNYIHDFISERTRHFLKIRLLLPRSSSGEELKKTDIRDLRSTRFLPDDILIEDALFLYGSKVAIISLNKNLPTGILIDDLNTYRTIKILFDMVWNQSSE
jgi:sugar-specific transcriptional regulator TrmB